MLFSALLVNAEKEEDKKPELPPIPKLLLEYVPQSPRPRAPATIYLECRYSAEYIFFVMPEDAQYLEVTLSREETTVWQTTVTRQNPTAVVSSLSGEYDIICRTDGNQIFGGEITF